MSSLKIPRYNDELDIKLLKYVFLKKLPIFLLIFISIIFIVYVFLRYSQPVYESKTIIQIEEETKTNLIFQLEGQQNEQLSKKIELLRSKVFIQNVLSQLPLDVSYFVRGQILTHEIYRQSPYVVNYRVLDNSIYGEEINLRHLDNSTFQINYQNSKKSRLNEVSKNIELNNWYRFQEFEVLIELSDNPAAKQELFDRQNQYFFIINNPEHIYRKYVGQITSTVLSEVSRSLQVSVRCRNSLKASDIANTIATQFQYFDIERKSKSANSILVFIEEQLTSVQNKLAELQNEIVSYKLQHNISDFNDTKEQGMQSSINSLRDEIARFEFEQSLLEGVYKELTSKETIDPILLITILSGSTYQGQFSTYINSLSQLITRKDQLLKQANPNSTFINSIDNQIKSQKEFFIKTLQRIIKNNDIRISELKSRYDKELNQVLFTDNVLSLEFLQLEQQYAITEQFYNQLIQKKIEFSILRAGFVPENIILEKALPHGTIVFPNKNKFYTIAIIISVILSLMLLTFYYINYNGIVNASEINKYTTLPVLGVVPKFLVDIPLSHFVVEKYPRSILAESFRSIRSNLQFINNQAGSKVISITSTMSGEGKTFFSINLAGALAVSGNKVIIIDLDLRKPNVHKYLKLQNEKGMSTILSRQCLYSDCIQTTRNENVSFISAGPIPPNPSELIQNGEIDSLLESLKKDYDYIFIDNPPIGLVSDSLTTIQKADFPIFILRANYSKRNFLTLPEKIHTVYGIKSLSIVLNAYDDTVSNLGIEKDLVYAYSYVKGIAKSGKNAYYEEDLPLKTSIFKRIYNYYFKK